MLLLEGTKNPYFIALFLVVFLGIFIFGIFFNKKAIILREMRKSKAKPIGSVRNGEYVKIIGKALHVKEPLIAPISGRQCIFYHTEVIHGSGKNRKTIIDELRTQDFFIEQNGEMVMVKMDQANRFRKIHLVQDHQFNTGIFGEKKEHLEKYLQRNGESSTYWIGLKKDLSYREGIIELNEIVAVKGIAEWKTLKEPIEGFRYSKILNLKGSKEKKLLITDHKSALKDPK
ncbi:MAG: hypothetical protein Aureis2KO_00950 [Aureisphaera sp.]